MNPVLTELDIKLVSAQAALDIAERELFVKVLGWSTWWQAHAPPEKLPGDGVSPSEMVCSAAVVYADQFRFVQSIKREIRKAESKDDGK